MPMVFHGRTRTRTLRSLRTSSLLKLPRESISVEEECWIPTDFFLSWINVIIGHTPVLVSWHMQNITHSIEYLYSYILIVIVISIQFLIGLGNSFIKCRFKFPNTLLADAVAAEDRLTDTHTLRSGNPSLVFEETLAYTVKMTRNDSPSTANVAILEPRTISVKIFFTVQDYFI